MPRVARASSSSGVYHVMVRGIKGEDIFLDDTDRRAYLRLLARLKDEVQLIIYGYCLMDNHVHLLIKEGKEPLSTSMKRIGVAYAVGFNSKYGRSGYLFQGRFRSEPVEDEAYFLTVLRYIHQNPINAGLGHDCASFHWSSYREYAFEEMPGGLVNTHFAIELMGGRQRFIDFTNTINEDACLDLEERSQVTDKQIRDRLRQLLQSAGGKPLLELAARDRNRVLCQLKDMDGASIRQIAQAIGVSKKMVEKA